MVILRAVRDDSEIPVDDKNVRTFVYTRARIETRDPWCESFSDANRDSHDGYLWTAVWMKILAIIRARSTHACLSPLHSYFHTKGNGMAMLGGKSISIAVNRRPFTPVVLFESSRRMESYVAQKCRDFSHRTTSVPLTWMARARLSLKPRTEKERNDKKEGGRGKEEKKEGRKEERSASRAFSRGGEGEGNSKEAGISSAFAWKYRSRDGIPIDRIFRNGEILQSLPSLLSRFIIFRLYHLPLLITVNGN